MGHSNPTMADGDGDMEIRKMYGNPMIKTSDMHEDMRGDALDAVQTAIDTKPNFEAAAKAVKEIMDKKYGPSWHCIIGTNFSFEVTYQMKMLLHMYFNGWGSCCTNNNLSLSYQQKREHQQIHLSH